MTEPIRPSTDPLELFRAWLDDAARAGIDLPEAACLATATPDGAPSARMVLYKGSSDGRVCFFTNDGSRKARELLANPRATLVFYWHELHRQVRIEGRAERLDDADCDTYFATRPRDSRLSAWASRQSEPVDSRETMLERYREAEARFARGDVPRPDFWGGYVLEPLAIEFWAGFENRLHDRVRYRRNGSGWSWSRLQP